jgi:FkbM family methyltransferase
MSAQSNVAYDISSEADPRTENAPRHSSRHAAPTTLKAAISAFLRQHPTMSFVQIGGFDGVSFDPLRPHIEGGRLTGLIVEPLPAPFAKLQALYEGSKTVRVCNCAIHDEEGEQTIWRFNPAAIEQGFLDSSFGGISSFKMDDLLADGGSLGKFFTDENRAVLRTLIEPVGVPCMRFPTLLERHDIKNVDLLQIDAEGYDLNILKAFDFDAFRPAIVNFEHLHLSLPDREEARQLLSGFGYDIHPDESDTLAVLREMTLPATSTPTTDVATFDGLRGNVIFCVWTGSNALTSNRAEALLSIYRESCCPVLFLTQHNIARWEHPEAPFHPAYPFLSETHKADYLRVYLLHHFGGGYTDMKSTSISWTPFFDRLRADENAIGLGYPEIGPQGVAPCGEPLESELRREYHKLIGNCAYIFRKQSAFTERWINATHELLDTKLDALRANPAKHPMDQKGVTLPDQTISNYPLRWSEMLGEIFHPLTYEFHDRIIKAEIAPSFQNYR